MLDLYSLLPTDLCDRLAKVRINLGYNFANFSNASDDACVIPSPFSAVGTGRNSIIADLYERETSVYSTNFPKAQHCVPVRRLGLVCNLLVESGKSVHNRRLLKLFLKGGELLFQFDDFVPQVGDFPFEFHQALGVG
jgi:hypothetical protein